MKITLEIPDTTRCAFFNFVWGGCDGLNMQVHQICSDDMHDGAIIVVKELKGD